MHTAQYKYINSKENGNPLRLRENESQAKAISHRKNPKISNKATEAGGGGGGYLEGCLSEFK